MTRATGPRAPVTAGNPAAMWHILALCWGLAALTWLVWIAAHAAAALAGGHVPAFSAQWAASLASGQTGRAWPGTPAAGST